MSDETWRHIVGERDCYEVSSHGRVRNTETGVVRKPTRTSHGYFVVGFKHNNRQTLKYVHDIVSIAFIGPKGAGCSVNHIDGNKANNSVGNLEIVACGDNTRHAHLTGLCDNRGQRHGMSKLSDADVRSALALINSGLSDGKIGLRFGVNPETIRRIRIGKGWRHVTGRSLNISPQ